MSRLARAFAGATLSLALFGLGRFVFNLLGLRVFGSAEIGRLNIGLSTWTLIAVLASSVPSVIAAKYVAEWLGAGSRDRAGRVLACALMATWIAYGAMVLVAAVRDPSALATAWPYYGGAYATYLVMRSAYFAHQRTAAILQMESVAFGMFIVTLIAAVFARSPGLAAFALTLQPLVYSLQAVMGLRREIVLAGAMEEARVNAREYSVFALAAFANSATGLASYHLVVVLAGALVPRIEDVGYLSVMLSTLSPLNLVPQALGSVLLADFARRQGMQDSDRPRHVALRATLFLQVFVLVFIGPLLAFPAPVFKAAHIPLEPDIASTWKWLLFTIGLNIVSSPCGHFLTASRYAIKQAVASVVFLVVGVVVGLLGMPEAGVRAAGWARFAIDGGLAWERMILAERMAAWVRGWGFSLLTFQLVFASVFLSGLFEASAVVRIAALALGLTALMLSARSELVASVSILRSLRRS